jgi:drug/metabolite transporter (DMT)-like permease
MALKGPPVTQAGPRPEGNEDALCGPRGPAIVPGGRGAPFAHGSAVAAMVAVTLMWSLAGVVSRHLESAGRLEITFWRSAFNALALAAMLLAWKGRGWLVASIRDGGRALWLSAACWAVMYTAFMVAIMITTVANVLVTMAIAPLLTAIIARIALGQRLPARTWAAIAAAGAGIAWMYGQEIAGDSRHLAGTLVAVCVPVAAAINWTLIQHTQRGPRSADRPAVDLLAAVLLGALISAAAALPFALPFAATGRDVALLALLGSVQLAIPCLLAVQVARVLSAPEISLLGLLEVVFGVCWVWLAGGEKPSAAVLTGGSLVLAALAANEWAAMRGRAPARQFDGLAPAFSDVGGAGEGAAPSSAAGAAAGAGPARPTPASD